MKTTSIPKTFTHFTSKRNAESIRRKGLLAVRDPFLSSPEYSRPGVNLNAGGVDWSLGGYRNPQVKVLVSTSALDPKKFVNFGQGFWRYLGPISADSIVKISDKK